MAGFLHTLPKKLVLGSLKYQIVLFLPGFIFLCLLVLGVLEEPSQDASLEKSFLARITIIFLWITLFSSSALFSCLGALFSRASRGGIDQIEFEDGSATLSIHIVGTIIGFLMVLIFLGGFLAGTLFPNFTDVGIYSLYFSFSQPLQWAKLLVWSFVAGFSERLVPNLLENLAQKISEEGSDKS